MKTIIASLPSYNITWTATRSKHVVTYGLQVKEFTGPDRDLRASEEFGHCVLHSAFCEGLIHNTTSLD